MRVEYTPDSAEVWTDFFQSGHGFVGIPFQRGAGLGAIFRSIFRTLMPLAKSAGKAIGREALSTGAQVASDIVAGENFKDSMKKHGRTGASNLLRKAADKIEGGRLKRKKTIKRSAKRQKLKDNLGSYYATNY